MTTRKKATKRAPAPATGEIEYRCVRGVLGEPASDARARGLPLCGADLSTLVRAVPADGKDHTKTCPRCKGEFSLMRTPPDRS